jgi:hypothetical protein
MCSDIHPGDCVHFPADAFGHVREWTGDTHTAGMRRTTSKTHLALRDR